MYFLLKNGDVIPASYVSLAEGTMNEDVHLLLKIRGILP